MRDRTYIIHIQERIDRIEYYTQEGREAFEASPVIQDAVIRNFEVIGEAVKQLSPEIKARYPEVSWRDVAGLRDVLIHNYIGVDVNVLWNIVEKDLPTLKRTIDAMYLAIEKA